MLRLIALAILATTGVAAADDGSQTFYSVPLDIGAALRRTAPNVASVGLRPEAMVVQRGTGVRTGFGVFAEGVVMDGSPREWLLGGGLTLAGYGDTFAFAVSVGGDARWSGGESDAQLVGSVFVGVRDALHLEVLDLPIGLRFDARRGTDTIPGSVTISFAFDTMIIVGSVLFAKSIPDVNK